MIDDNSMGNKGYLPFVSNIEESCVTTTHKIFCVHQAKENRMPEQSHKGGIFKLFNKNSFSDLFKSFLYSSSNPHLHIVRRNSVQINFLFISFTFLFEKFIIRLHIFEL